MPSSNLDRFIETIQGGARPNQFFVNVDLPGFELTDQSTLLCKSGSLPESTLGTVVIPFRGREIKAAGDRTYGTWTASFISDRLMEVRSEFEKWNNLMNRHKDGSAPYNLISGTGPDIYSRSYGRNVIIGQLERNNSDFGSIIKIYILRHAFPATVGSIELAYDNNNTYSEFTVDFEYTYFESTDIETNLPENLVFGAGDARRSLARTFRDLATGDINTIRLQLENTIQGLTGN